MFTPAATLLTWLEAHAPQILADPANDPAAMQAAAARTTAAHAALTGTLALVPQPGWAPILVEGQDALAYLQRRLSQAIAPLELGQGGHALQLAGDGRLQAEYLVYRGHEALFALAPAPAVREAAELIEKYTLNDDVTVDPFWEGECLVALAGPLAPALIASLLDPRTEEARLRDSPWIAYFTVNLAGLPCRILRDGRWPVPWFNLLIPPMALEQMLSYLHEAVVAAGGQVAGAAAVERLRIEAGLPAWGRDIVAGQIPLEAHLQRTAISFTKGCYPGQEVIARITNLGHPAQALVRLSVAGEHAGLEGAALLAEGHAPGRVTSAISWPGLGETLALGYLPWDAREAPAVAITRESAAPLPSRVTLLPLA